MAVYAAKNQNVHFDPLKGIKIHRVLPIDLETWNLATSKVLKDKDREKSEKWKFGYVSYKKNYK